MTLDFYVESLKKSFTPYRTPLIFILCSKKPSGGFFWTMLWTPHIWVSIIKCIHILCPRNFYLAILVAPCDLLMDNLLNSVLVNRLSIFENTIWTTMLCYLLVLPFSHNPQPIAARPAIFIAQFFYRNKR